MTVAKITEITSSSSLSFDDAVTQGIERANKTIKNIKSAWVADQRVTVEEGKISEYIVRMKITFVLE